MSDMNATRDVPMREDLRAKLVPATYVDAFYIEVLGPITRIIFAETIAEGHTPAVRIAVAMPTEDARDLSAVLARLIERTVPPREGA